LIFILYIKKITEHFQKLLCQKKAPELATSNNALKEMVGNLDPGFPHVSVNHEVVLNQRHFQSRKAERKSGQRQVKGHESKSNILWIICTLSFLSEIIHCYSASSGFILRVTHVNNGPLCLSRAHNISMLEYSIDI
jgi:hypothetical protein